MTRTTLLDSVLSNALLASAGIALLAWLRVPQTRETGAKAPARRPAPRPRVPREWRAPAPAVTELPLSAFQEAIERQHGCASSLVARVLVQDPLRDLVAWQCDVRTFALHGHARATHCYAWEEAGRIESVLHDERIASPQAAVRARAIR